MPMKKRPYWLKCGFIGIVISLICWIIAFVIGNMIAARSDMPGAAAIIMVFLLLPVLVAGFLLGAGFGKLESMGKKDKTLPFVVYGIIIGYFLLVLPIKYILMFLAHKLNLLPYAANSFVIAGLFAAIIGGAVGFKLSKK